MIGMMLGHWLRRKWNVCLISGRRIDGLLQIGMRPCARMALKKLDFVR
jgi:hypothetical protein